MRYRFPVSRRWSPQANPTARHHRTLRDHVIRLMRTTWYACLLPSFRWYQIILLGDRGSRVWTRLLRSSVAFGPRTRDSWIASPTPPRHWISSAPPTISLKVHYIVSTPCEKEKRKDFRWRLNVTICLYLVPVSMGAYKCKSAAVCCPGLQWI